ncbi:MAG: exodeoxyribonuclease VII large subunit [Desulfomonilia bacterium]
MASTVNCFRVSQLNELAREALNSYFGPEVWVVGEIQGLKEHGRSGHVYFDLVEKPSGERENYIAKVNCAFFKGAILHWEKNLAAQGFPHFTLSSGLEVKARARVDLYTKEGRYQLIISEIDPSYTLGAIERRRAQTIESLRTSGLMDRNKTLDIPAPLLNIGLITSDGSAAYNDFISILRKSGYSFRITLFDAYMQGERTAREVTQAITVLERLPEVDAIAIIRGGGSRTDLFYFDDLSLCRRIALSRKPILTGIGHEIDFSVADMVAHTFFVTPTDLARYLVEEADSVWNVLEEALDTLGDLSRRTLENAMHSVTHLGFNLVHVSKRALDAMDFRVRSVVQTLYRISLGIISHHEGQIQNVQTEFHHTAVTMLRDLREKLSSLDQFFDLMKPSEILKRGYSITLNSRKKAITDPSGVDIQENITTILQTGRIHSSVTGKE